MLWLWRMTVVWRSICMQMIWKWWCRGRESSWIWCLWQPVIQNQPQGFSSKLVHTMWSASTETTKFKTKLSLLSPKASMQNCGVRGLRSASVSKQPNTQWKWLMDRKTLNILRCSRPMSPKNALFMGISSWDVLPLRKRNPCSGVKHPTYWASKGIKTSNKSWSPNFSLQKSTFV